MKVIIGLIFLFLVFFTFIGFYFTNRILYIKKKEDSFILERELNAGSFDQGSYDALPKTDVLIPSPFGYHIKAIVIEPLETNKYMIFSHGVTETKTNSIKYMNLFMERGFNGIIFDHRRHGETGGNTTSYGYFEKFDLKAVVDWLKQEKGPDIKIGIHGESMGAATMLLYSGMLEDGADFYISDCPYSDFKEQLKHLLETDMKLPPKLILPIAEIFLKLRGNYTLRDISPLAVIENIKRPVLFIHSLPDTYILPSMTQTLYERKKGAKKLFFAKVGAHAESYNKNKQEYENAIDEFLEEFVAETEDFKVFL